MLAVSSVSKLFGATVALADVSLDVASGQTVAVIGPSGCGKSTLLRIVNGIVLPDGGSVTIGGERLSRANAAGLRHDMGYVIQEGGLFPNMTARRNAELLARYLGWPPERIAQRTAALSDAVRLQDDVLDRYPLELSGGQRQRVSLMRALFVDPHLLLLDEPLGALDPMIRAELQVDLRRLFAEMRKTVVLVTHDLDEAAYFADRIVLMNGGRIVEEGSIASLERSVDPFVSTFVAAQHLTRRGTA